MTHLYSIFEKLYKEKSVTAEKWKMAFWNCFLTPGSSCPSHHDNIEKFNDLTITSPNSQSNACCDGSTQTHLDFMDDLVFLVSDESAFDFNEKSVKQSEPIEGVTSSFTAHYTQEDDNDKESNKLLQPKVQVMRREQCRRKLFSTAAVESSPSACTNIHWKSTFYLNIIVQYIQYSLVLGICEQTSNMGNLRLLRRFDKKMYASPTRRRLDTKGHEEEMVYPYIYFMLDTFDETMEQCNLHQSELFYVELVAYDPGKERISSLFRRFVKYETLDTVLSDAKISRSSSGKNQKPLSASSSMRHREKPDLMDDSSLVYQRTDTHFFPCLGSEGKGCVELAVYKTYPTSSKSSHSQVVSKQDMPISAASSRFGMSGMSSLFWSNTGVRKSRSDMNLQDKRRVSSSSTVNEKQLMLESSQDFSSSGSGTINRLVDQAWSWFTSSTYEPLYGHQTNGKSTIPGSSNVSVGASSSPKPYVNMAITYISIPCEEILQDFFEFKRPPKLRLQ